MTDSDEALVRKSMNGDRASFEELVRRTARLVFSPRHAAAVARWLEYRMNLFDGVEG